MATSKTATTSTTTKEKRVYPPAFNRVSDTLKREVLKGKLSKDELTKLAELATALHAFAA